MRGLAGHSYHIQHNTNSFNRCSHTQLTLRHWIKSPQRSLELSTSDDCPSGSMMCLGIELEYL